jgi:hypothetical protein
LEGRNQIRGEGSCLARATSVLAKLPVGPVDVDGQESRSCLRERSIRTELLEFLTQASVWTPELDYPVGGVERCPNEAL